jgi:excisionase family DNA binding protein
MSDELAQQPRKAYTVAEAQHLLSIGRNSMYQLISTGEIHSVRKGRRILVPESAIDRYLAPPAEGMNT